MYLLNMLKMKGSRMEEITWLEEFISEFALGVVIKSEIFILLPYE